MASVFEYFDSSKNGKLMEVLLYACIWLKAVRVSHYILAPLIKVFLGYYTNAHARNLNHNYAFFSSKVKESHLLSLHDCTGRRSSAVERLLGD